MERLASTTLILFGISGDLSKRKVLPSLIHLYEKDLLPPNFHIVGISRRDITLDAIFKDFSKNFYSELLNRFKNICEIIKLNVDDIHDFEKLDIKLNIIDKDHNKNERIFYLSVPPDTLLNLIESLGSTQRSSSRKNITTKLIFEKPFGTNLYSAQNLIAKTAHYYTDDEVYHIDHYLAKQMVQNILIWKEKYGEFQKYLSGHTIKKIEILSLESIGVEGRADFYNHTGALRDLVQSHLLEVLALFINKPNLSRESALRELALDLKSIKRGQYKGYRDEINDSTSLTETFAQTGFYSNNTVWENVEFLLITGKAIDKKSFQINLYDKNNNCTISIQMQPQPEVRYSLKLPENLLEDLKNIDTDILEQNSNYEDHELLLLDIFKGKKDLFLSNEEILLSWKLIDPIIERWSHQTNDLFIYDKGSNLIEINKIYENSQNK